MSPLACCAVNACYVGVSGVGSLGVVQGLCTTYIANVIAVPLLNNLLAGVCSTVGRAGIVSICNCLAVNGPGACGSGCSQPQLGSGFAISSPINTLSGETECGTGSNFFCPTSQVCHTKLGTQAAYCCSGGEIFRSRRLFLMRKLIFQQPSTASMIS
jgi:hypothetical protein